MKVEVVEQPKLRLASVRHVGSYMNVREAFVRLDELVTAAGLTKPDTILVGIYHDDPSTTPEDKLRSNAAITVSPIREDVRRRVAPRGPTALRCSASPA